MTNNWKKVTANFASSYYAIKITRKYCKFKLYLPQHEKHRSGDNYLHHMQYMCVRSYLLEEIPQPWQYMGISHTKKELQLPLLKLKKYKETILIESLSRIFYFYHYLIFETTRSWDFNQRPKLFSGKLYFGRSV